MVERKEIHIFAEVVEPKALDQFYRAMALPCNVAGALMPDVHAGYTLPIGGVVKSEGKIFPAYVGYDIGCGVATVRLDLDADALDKEALEKIKNEILARVPVGPHDHGSKTARWDDYKKGTQIAREAFEGKGGRQMGTLGGGNHFLEIGTDKVTGKVWITVHSGSRGFGYKIAEAYMRLAAMANTDEARYAKEFEAKNRGREHNPDGWEKAKQEFIYRRVRACLKTDLEGHHGLDLESALGQEYLLDMGIALDFALENRKRMLEAAMAAIRKVTGEKAEIEQFINRNHNHAELVEGGRFVIHRKGATHAEEGMWGVVPGNMRDGCFIVKGKGYAPALFSSSHGAGRVLSRSQAKTRLDFGEFLQDMEGVVTNIDETTLDESPRAYKNIFEVMAQQEKMVESVYHVMPLLNIKG